MDTTTELSSRWPSGRWSLAPLRRAGWWLLVLVFVAYVGVALLWLLVGLLPALFWRIDALQAFLLALRQPGHPLDLGPLVSGIQWASYSFRYTSEPQYLAVSYLFSLANIALGIALVRLRPADRLAWLLALGLIGTGAIFNAEAHVILEFSPQWVENTHEILHIFAGATYAVALLLFPTGTLPPSPFPNLRLPRWLDWPLRVLLLFCVGTLGWSLIGGMHGDPWTFVAFFGILIPLIGGLAQLFRYTRAMSDVEKHQSRTLLFTLLLGAGLAATLLAVAGLLSAPSLWAPGFRLTPPVARVLERVAFVVFPLLFTVIPVSLSFIVLRYRLWELNLVINRSLIYGTLTAAVAGLYILIVGGVGALLQGRWHGMLTALTIGLVAALVQPLRDRVQAGVNRLMFGERDDPIEVLARLGRRLEATGTADDVLAAIVETVARTLKLPYVALAVQQEDGFRAMAAHGEPVETVEEFPLVDRGEVVGKLLVARRATDGSLHRADRRLLENVARQAGPAVHSVLLAAALQRSRRRLVTAREEERRHLRRDLHDGLGPELASLRLKVDAARNSLHSDPAQSERLLLEVQEQVGEAIASVRRTAHGLRPPALDQLGLVPALREHALTLAAQEGLQVTIVGPDGLPPLPAAVEVAAYHIVMEGLTNIVRHAHAHRCYVGLCLSGALHLVVEDDGTGLPAQVQAGVGLASMRERMSELGGTFQIRSQPQQGTRIEVTLPLVPDSSRPDAEQPGWNRTAGQPDRPEEGE